MRYIHLLITSIVLNIAPVTLLADNEALAARLHYHPRTNVLIPGKIEITDKASIPAIVGEFLQSPIIKVKINGEGPFLFMFDTGFSQTLISKKVADKLNLPIVKSRRINNITPNQVLEVFQNVHFIEQMQIENVIINDYGVVASSSFEDDAKRFEKMRVDGVISANIFQGLLLTVDYKNEKLLVQKGELSSSDDGILAYQKDMDIPVIQGTIKFNKLKKEVTHNFVLDTGDDTYIYINICTIPEMRNFTDQDKFVRYDIYENPLEHSLARLYGDIIISNTAIIKSPYVTFSATHCGSSRFSDIGRLGRKFFETHEVTLDNKNGFAKVKAYEM